jgi:putative transposase
VEVVIIYIDGMVFGDHVMIGAVGVDAEGHKHVPAIREGATENATVAKELWEDLVVRGVDPDHKRLFVIDGSKALRAAIHAVFGNQHPVERCRAHKLRNVMDHLPEDQKNPVKSAVRAGCQSWQARLKKLADWLEREYPSAASSLMEGMEECFTINRLDVPPSLHRCLATTKSSRAPTLGCACEHAGCVRWRDSRMVKRWMASALLATEKNFRKDHGLSRSLGLGSDPQWIEVCHPTGGGVVRWQQPPLPTFDETRATFGCSIDNASAGACGGWEHRSPPRTQSHTPSAGVVTEWYKSRFRP